MLTIARERRKIRIVSRSLYMQLYNQNRENVIDRCGVALVPNDDVVAVIFIEKVNPDDNERLVIFLTNEEFSMSFIAPWMED